MSIRAGAVLPLICLFAVPVSASAQQRTAVFADAHPTIVSEEVAQAAPTNFHLQEPQSGMEMKPEEQMSTSGFFLGIVSMLAGAAIGSSIGQQECPSKDIDKDCMSRHGYTGALIAGSLMTPIGVHIAARRKHNLLGSMGMSAATGAVMYYAMRAVPGRPIAMAPFMAMPVQVILAVKMEKSQK